MAKRRGPPYPPPPLEHPLEHEFDGKTYRGYYTAEKGTLTVNLIGGGHKQAWLGKYTDEKSLANIVLSELITEMLRKKG